MAESSEGRAESADSAPRAEYPRPFGHYLLLQRIARGGMGEVFLAKHGGIAGIEKHCVVKTLRPHFTADREYVTRFIDEARVVVQLAHRNIAQIFDVGRVAKQYYLAMEFITGRDLRTITDRMREVELRLPPNLALHIVGEVLEALDYAHRHVDPGTGRPLYLVHRDVSPQNVMVSFEGEVKLIDFGLAHSTMKVEQTQPNVVMGKMAYMSPEQARGDDVDGRADLFSAAVLCYELLFGERFYEGMGFDQIWGVAGAGGYRPRKWDQLPEGLERALSRAIEASRSDRFATCADFKDALVEYQMSAGIRPVGRELRHFMGELFGSESLAHRELIARFKNVSALPSGPHLHAPPPDEDSQSFAVSSVESFLEQVPLPSRQSEVIPLHLADRTRVDPQGPPGDTELQPPGTAPGRDTSVSTDPEATSLPEMPTLLHADSGSDSGSDSGAGARGAAADRTRVEALWESTVYVRADSTGGERASPSSKARSRKWLTAVFGGVMSAAVVAGLVAAALWERPGPGEGAAPPGAQGRSSGTATSAVENAPVRPSATATDPAGETPPEVRTAEEVAAVDDGEAKTDVEADVEERPEEPPGEVAANTDVEAAPPSGANDDSDAQQLKRARRTPKKKPPGGRVEKRSARKAVAREPVPSKTEAAKPWLTPAQKKQSFSTSDQAINFLRDHCLGKVACAARYDRPSFVKMMGPGSSTQDAQTYLEGAGKCARVCQRASP